jgi:hypothetical protein
MRSAMGVAVFTGMIGVTLFGLFLTPVSDGVLRGSRVAARGPVASTQAPPLD